MSYQIKLDTFEGPLDLLLHLIEKEEMDIYDIQISKITEQYLDYLNTMQALKLEIASEFLVMAATLLSIKSKMLLPNNDIESQFIDIEIEEDPREELFRRLIEYKKFKSVSEQLKILEIERNQIFTRPPSNISQYKVQVDENPINGLSIYHLIEAFEKALRKQSYKDPLTKIEREEISVKDRMGEIINYLKNKNDSVYFSELFVNRYNKSDMVVTFLSLLELMKQKVVFCIQTKTFDDIVVQYIGDKGELNYELQ